MIFLCFYVYSYNYIQSVAKVRNFQDILTAHKKKNPENFRDFSFLTQTQ